MKKIIRSFIVLFIALVLSACVSVDERLKREFDQIRRGPAGAPYKNITGFSSALQCMDQLMLAHKVKNIPILIEAIEDKTEAVNAGTRDMLISAISEMTVQSRAIKIIAYGKDSTNLISYMKVAKQGNAYKQMPMFDIQGSISQHDENVISTGNSLGLFTRKEGGTGYSNSTALSTIAMDLNVLNVSDMSVVPGVNARNSIAVLRKGTSFDMDASINKLGVYFDISLSRTEGKTQALRNLVELSAIELIGKLTNVPYGQCLGAQRQYAPRVHSMNMAAQQVAEGHSDHDNYSHQSQLTSNIAADAGQAGSQVAGVATAQTEYAMPAGSQQLPAQARQSTPHSSLSQRQQKRQLQARQVAPTQAVNSAEETDKSGILVHKCCKYGS